MHNPARYQQRTAKQNRCKPTPILQTNNTAWKLYLHPLLVMSSGGVPKQVS